MSELAERERRAKRGWAAPGSAHDFLVRLLKIGLPAGIGILLAYLALAPLNKGKEISFVLDKNKVETAEERMRLQSAQYHGQDNSGRAFVVNAQSAVQQRSNVPVVDIRTMAAEISLDDGPASLNADQARYDMDTEQIDVLGPILFTAADGYRLRTRDVNVNLRERRMQSAGDVQGQMPLGRFTAERMEVDLPDKRVVLTGRARLHIVQGGLR